MKFFSVYQPIPPLSFSDKLEFINMWYILILVNDVLTIFGSIFKIMIENKVGLSFKLNKIM